MINTTHTSRVLKETGKIYYQDQIKKIQGDSDKQQVEKSKIESTRNEFARKERNWKLITIATAVVAITALVAFSILLSPYALLAAPLALGLILRAYTNAGVYERLKGHENERWKTENNTFEKLTCEKSANERRLNFCESEGEIVSQVTREALLKIFIESDEI